MIVAEFFLLVPYIIILSLNVLLIFRLVYQNIFKNWSNTEKNEIVIFIFLFCPFSNPVSILSVTCRCDNILPQYIFRRCASHKWPTFCGCFTSFSVSIDINTSWYNWYHSYFGVQSTVYHIAMDISKHIIQSIFIGPRYPWSDMGPVLSNSPCHKTINQINQ